MIINLDGLEVLFPYDLIYPEQYRYMLELKRSLDAGGSCILEMPSGTGKTVCLLSLTVAYMVIFPHKYLKIVYCSRTVPEIVKVTEELKNLYNYYESNKKMLKFLSICLTSRRHLCINSDVVSSTQHDGVVVDAKCHALIAPSFRSKDNQSVGDCSCSYYENFELEGFDYSLPFGVYSIEDFKNVGTGKGWCPYYMSRQAVSACNILIYSYHYLLDPKIAQIVSKEIPANSIVIFDEAHNIDGVCIEAFSVLIKRKTIKDSIKHLKHLEDKVLELKQAGSVKLQEEYKLMLEALQKKAEDNKNDLYLSNPILPQDLLEELVPGNIRKADHFIFFMKRLVDFFAFKLTSKSVFVESPNTFMRQLYEKTLIDHRPLRLCSERLRSLIYTLEVEADASLSSCLCRIADFATILSSYQQGFCVITEPYEPSTPTIFDPKLLLGCMDATLAVKPIFSRFKSVVITSGTLSPLHIYPKLLSFHPVIVSSLPMSLYRESLCPIVVSKGSDQALISSKFADRQELNVIRNYGMLVHEVCSTVPDGVVCFFTSYKHMESCIASWVDMGLMAKIQKMKLVFTETPNTRETAVALQAYRKACEIGRGACFMSIARGKISEGIDFHNFYGRAIVIIGVPYIYTQSYFLRSRLEYLKERYGISESDFLTFDALRHTAQCLGRAIRGKSDYGIMVLADYRFSKRDKIRKLPRWIQEHLQPQHIGLTTDEAVNVCRRFLRKMGQPIDHAKQMGVSLLDKAAVESEEFKKSLQLSIMAENTRIGPM